MKVCIVSSCGGHLTEVRCLKEIYERYEVSYILNHTAKLPIDMKLNTFYITHSERDLKSLINIFELFKLFKRLKPDVILSTGAGPAVPAGIVARLMGVHTIYIETITRVSKPSLTGYFMRYLAQDVFYQWPTLAPFFPKGKYIGTLI